MSMLAGELKAAVEDVRPTKAVWAKITIDGQEFNVPVTEIKPEGDFLFLIAGTYDERESQP
jgi:hypothetical protein